MSAIQICNTSQEKIVLPRRTYNMMGWVIPPCPEGKPFSSVVIDDQMDVKKVYVEYDEAKAEKIPVPVPATEVISDYFSNERLKERGCFTIGAGEIPTAAQVDEARNTRTRWLQGLVEAGDKEYLRTKRVDEIPDFCKRAVAELHLTREWAVVAPPPQTSCPACGETIKVGVAICKTCKAILDPAKAREFGLLDEEERPAAKAVGSVNKPKKNNDEGISGI